jgi:hypothetical protein
MILTAHQPVYLPWLGLFHKIALADSFCIFDQVQYLPKDWNNRNQIKTPSGPLMLTVPVLTTGYLDKTLLDMKINNSVNWQRKHWNSIMLAYKKAPYFNLYADFFEDLYKRKWENLVDLNNHFLFYSLDSLGLKPKITYAHEQNFEGTKSDLVLDMCKKLEANLYIFGKLGKDYANNGSFKKAGVKLYFQDYNHPVYPQLHGKFEPYCSIIDLLFNCGKDSLSILMSGNISKDDLKTLAI